VAHDGYAVVASLRDPTRHTGNQYGQPSVVSAEGGLMTDDLRGRGTAWLVFALAAAAAFGNSYVYDSIGPVADLLQRQRGFGDTQIGMLNAIYSLPNVVLVLVGGMLVDRLGAARVAVATAAVCGAFFKTLPSRGCRPSTTSSISLRMPMSASQKRSISRRGSLSVGSTMSVPATGNDRVGA
jgi:MFS family permease